MSKLGAALTQPEGDRTNYREGYVIKEDFTVRIRISVRPRIHVHGRLEGSDLEFAHLYNALRRKHDMGTAELLKKDGKFYLHVTISKDFNQSYVPRTFIGIDVNENSIAILALDESGSTEIGDSGIQRAGEVKLRIRKI